MSDRLRRRYPLEPLIAWLTVNFPHDDKDLVEIEQGDGTVVVRITNERAAELLGSTRGSVVRHRRDGVPEDAADEMAVHLGLVPGLVWEDYDDAPINMILTVHPDRRGQARKLLARGESVEHLDCAPAGRHRAG